MLNEKYNRGMSSSTCYEQKNFLVPGFEPGTSVMKASALTNTAWKVAPGKMSTGVLYGSQAEVNVK